MARIRTIKPDFFHDECLSELSLQHRLTFIGLWLYADREGRLEDRPKYLKAQLWPYDKCDMESLLDDLNDKYIKRYQVDGRSYIQVVNFLKHQKPHHTEKESTIPELTNGTLTVKEPLNNGDTPVGREGKGKEGKCAEIVQHLNETIGSNYLPTTKATYSAIMARLSDGYTVEDFKTVHQKKYDEWKGTEHEKYLRPSTLYRPQNFEEYLNQKINKREVNNKSMSSSGPNLPEFTEHLK